MSVSDDHGQPAQNFDPLSEFFRPEFTGPSIGTEQELLGVQMWRARDTSRRIGEVLLGKEVLVIVTTDTVHAKPADDRWACTLELVITPTEATDKEGWVNRLHALEMVVDQIQLAARRTANGGELRDIDLGGGLTVRIFNKDHRIAKPERATAAEVTGSDKQGTVGVPADQLLQPFLPSNSKLPLAQGLPVPRWYGAEAAQRAPAQSSPRGVQAYALIESAIRNFITILSKHEAQLMAIIYAGRAFALAAQALAQDKLMQDKLGQDKAGTDHGPAAAGLGAEAEAFALELHQAARKSMATLIITPGWKDSWNPLPRTPVINLLDQLTVAEATRIREALEAFAIPGLPTAVMDWARNHILKGESLGGHLLPVPTINHHKGFLMEYRSAPPEFFTDKFLYIATEKRDLR